MSTGCFRLNRLKGLYPQLDISYEMSEKYMNSLKLYILTSGMLSLDGEKGPWVRGYMVKFEKAQVNPTVWWLQLLLQCRLYTL